MWRTGEEGNGLLPSAKWKTQEERPLSSWMQPRGDRQEMGTDRKETDLTKCRDQSP